MISVRPTRRKPNLGRRGGLERRQGDQWQRHIEAAPLPAFGQALDRVGGDQLDHQAERRAGHARHRDDADAARLDAAGDGGRRGGSATSRAPPSIRRNARSDLPLPAGPSSSTPTSSSATQVP
jgi:hypothetical protein